MMLIVFVFKPILLIIFFILYLENIIFVKCLIYNLYIKDPL